MKKLDDVMQSLLKLSDSLKPEVSTLLPFFYLFTYSKEPFQGAVHSLPAHTDPTSPRVRKSGFETHSETEMRLGNELASNQRKLTLAVLKVAKVEKELEALNTFVSPDVSQPDGIHPFSRCLCVFHLIS